MGFSLVSGVGIGGSRDWDELEAAMDCTEYRSSSTSLTSSCDKSKPAKEKMEVDNICPEVQKENSDC